MSYFEEPARQPQYSNACIVRSYQGKKLAYQANGTLCQHEEKVFLLTLADTVQGNRHTAIFQDQVERPIHQLNRVTKTDKVGFKRSLLAIGLILDWPEDVIPAELEVRTMFQPYPGQPSTCLIAGYGSRLTSYTPKTPVIYNGETTSLDQLLVPSFMSLKLSPIFKTIYNTGDGPDLNGHYYLHGSPEATPYERPIPPGFSGAALRSSDNKVVGIAIASIPYWQTNEFSQKHPIAAKTFYKLHDWVNSIKNPTSSSVVTLAVGSAFTYQAFLYSPLLGFCSSFITAATTYFSYRIKDLNKMLSYYTFPTGSESYGAQVSPWIASIKEIIGSEEL
ncbi:MAG: hypothetical protein ACTHJ4_07135 [Candidatus Nucleicultricaceae bacterium]